MSMRIPIVNEQDEIIKVIDINDRQLGEIARSAALWVTNEKGQILLAQRAFRKRNNGGCWGPAVGGSIEEGETYESNIIKEAAEEIGLTDITPIPFGKFRRSASKTEYFLQWFTVQIRSEYPLKKDDHEVERIGWFTGDEIIKLYTKDPKTFVPNFDKNIDLFLGTKFK